MVYAKRPFAGPQQVLDYVGRYTHRVAISNNRLLDIEGDQVQFNWKDYRDDDQVKTMTLSADEFIRRFLMHVMPNGFHRIRYYGFLGNRHRNEKLAAVPPTARYAHRRTSRRTAQARKGIPRALRRTHWPFLAPMSTLSARPNGEGRDLTESFRPLSKRHKLLMSAAVDRARTDDDRLGLPSASWTCGHAAGLLAQLRLFPLLSCQSAARTTTVCPPLAPTTPQHSLSDACPEIDRPLKTHRPSFCGAV